MCAAQIQPVKIFISFNTIVKKKPNEVFSSRSNLKTPKILPTIPVIRKTYILTEVRINHGNESNLSRFGVPNPLVRLIQTNMTWNEIIIIKVVTKNPV